jgi:hypothetical protein
MKWVLGCPSAQEGAATLRGFSLKGVAEKFPVRF